MKKRVFVSNEKFIVAWQTSNSVQEVADKTGRPPGSCRQTSANLRARGVPLKKMEQGRKKLNIPALAKLAADSLPKESR